MAKQVFMVGHKRAFNNQTVCTRLIDPAEGHPFRRWFWVFTPKGWR